MISSTDYCYMREDLINQFLKCSICSKPYVDPIKTADDKRSCRACTSSINVTPVTETLLLEMLDDLRIKCTKCHEENIRRGDYEKHKKSLCSKRIVTCKAVDLKCSWTGLYEQLNHHVQTCPFEILRPIFTEILANIQSKQINEESKQLSINYKQEYDEFKQEIEQLREQRTQLQNEIQKLTNEIGYYFSSRSSDNNQTNEIDNLTKLYNQQLNRNNELEIEIQRLKNLFLQQVSLYNKLRTEFEQYKQLIDQNNDIQQLQTEIQQPSERIPPPTSQIQSNEINNLKKLFNQHDVQIKLLARKKCVIPVISAHKNLELENLIDKFVNNSEIDLDGKQLTDPDMDIICKKAIIEKKCSKLRLQKNKFTGKGASILSNALYNNTTLIEVYLSKNQIGDIGLHALAQTLSVNSSTLKILDLYSNNITDEGIEYLSEMLKINKTIVRLGLGFNQISDYGIRLLTNSITYFNENLQWLSLSSNKLITDKCISSLIEILTCNSSLKTLWLNDCSLSQTTTIRLKEEAKKNENFILEI